MKLHMQIDHTITNPMVYFVLWYLHVYDWRVGKFINFAQTIMALLLMDALFWIIHADRNTITYPNNIFPVAESQDNWGYAGWVESLWFLMSLAAWFRQMWVSSSIRCIIVFIFIYQDILCISLAAWFRQNWV